MGREVAVEGDSDVDERREGHSAHHENQHQDQHHPRHLGAKISRHVQCAGARLPRVLCQLNTTQIFILLVISIF